MREAAQVAAAIARRSHRLEFIHTLNHDHENRFCLFLARALAVGMLDAWSGVAAVTDSVARASAALGQIWPR